MVLWLSSLAAAETSDNNRIALIDWRQALFATTAARQANQLLQDNIATEKQDILDLEQSLQTQQAQLERDALIMSEAEKTTLLQSLERDQRYYVEQVQRLQKIRGDAESAFLLRHQQSVEQSVEELAVKYNLTMILDVQTVLYARPDLNLTDELHQLLEQKLVDNGSASDDSHTSP